MWWTTLKWVFFGMALAMLGSNSTKAEPIPRSDDMFRELIKLDQLYSSIARPSLRSIPISSEVAQKVQRALNMVRLQQLDNMYSTRSRPRFGKRTEGNQLPAGNNISPEAFETNKMQFRNEDEESQRDWLPLRR
uniref:Neuropeptide F n=1 Tax=Dendroctonus armandi TaxID=77159 RepID=A0A8F7CH25_9CUCU|nr:neuropeptide F [Dendroctonus armandi]